MNRLSCFPGFSAENLALTEIKECQVSSVDAEIDEELREELQVHEQKQVIVHCKLLPEIPMEIRIWPSCYLSDHHSAHRSKLIQAYNIPFRPTWKKIHRNRIAKWTLIFEGLPGTCTVFDLYEETPANIGFKVINIPRNRSDVYNIWL